MIPKSWLQKLFDLLPAVLAGVVAVEKEIKAPGKAKKDIVLGTIAAAAHAGEAVPIPIVQGVSALIDEIVTTLNASGVFAHADPAANAVQAKPVPAA